MRKSKEKSLCGTHTVVPYSKELDRQRGRGQLAVESPLLWSDVELNYLPGSPTKFWKELKGSEGIRREYNELDTVWFMAGSLFQQCPYDIPTEAFPFEIFKQAFVAVQSCVVHLQRVSLARRFALVPLGPPLLSYGSRCKAMLTAVDDAVQLVVDRPYKAGDPIFVWRGPSDYPLPIRASEYTLSSQASNNPLPSGVSENALPNRGDPAIKFVGLEDRALQEAIAVDPYEAAVFTLPATVKERLLRILRLGIANRFDIHIECLRSLKELPESTAISVLDQFMILGADKDNKEAYLTALISKHQVPKLGLIGNPSSSSRVKDMSTKDSELSEPSSFSSRVQHPAFDSTSSHLEFTSTRSDGYPSRNSYMYSDYPLRSRASDNSMPIRASDYPLSIRASDYPLPIASDYPLPIRASDYTLSSQASDNPLPSGVSENALPNRASYGKLQEAFPASSHLTPGFSSPYGKIGLDSQATAAANRQPVIRFDPFTGEPYKFDPFTGEPIRPKSPPRHFRSPY